MKYLSHFEIENDKKEIINRKENQLIDKYIIDINNEVKNNLNNYKKEIEKLDIKKVKEEILISSKVLCSLQVINPAKSFQQVLILCFLFSNFLGIK